MRRSIVLLTAIILAGCLGGTAFQDRTAMSGTFTVQYELRSSTPQVEYISSTLERGPAWQRQDVQVRFFEELIDFSVYRHHATNESFVCYTSNTSRQGECLFLSERTLWPLLPTADPGVLADDPVDAVTIGPETVIGRACTRYEVDALSTYYYDTLTGGNETAVTDRLSLNVNQVNTSMCIDTTRHYIANQTMTIDQPGTTETIRMEAVSFRAGADPAPDRGLVLQADCGLRDGRLDVLPIDVSGQATVSINGDNRTITLEAMQRETITFGDAVASRIDPFFLIEVDGRTYRTGCT